MDKAQYLGKVHYRLGLPECAANYMIGYLESVQSAMDDAASDCPDLDLSLERVKLLKLAEDLREVSHIRRSILSKLYNEWGYRD